MKYVVFYVFLFTFTLLSCDGRYKLYKTNQEILKEHKLFESFSEQINYIPESYLETSNDTILSNGYKIKLKSFTDMDNSQLSYYTKDNIQYKNYYRNINTSITILKDNQEIFSKTVNKDTIIEFDESFNKSIKNKIIKGVWVDEYASLINNNVIIEMLFSEIGNNKSIHLKLVFNAQGDLYITEKYS